MKKYIDELFDKSLPAVIGTFSDFLDLNKIDDTLFSGDEILARMNFNQSVNLFADKLHVLVNTINYTDAIIKTTENASDKFISEFSKKGSAKRVEIMEALEKNKVDLGTSRVIPLQMIIELNKMAGDVKVQHKEVTIARGKGK